MSANTFEQSSPKRTKLDAADGCRQQPPHPVSTGECLQLLAWVRAGSNSEDVNLNNVGSVELRSEVGLGRGVYAISDLKAGELLFRISPEHIITTERALHSGLGVFLAKHFRIVKSTLGESLQVETSAAGPSTSASLETEAESDATCTATAVSDARPELTERSVLYAYLMQARHCDAIVIDKTAGEKNFGPYARSLPPTGRCHFS